MIFLGTSPRVALRIGGATAVFGLFIATVMLTFIGSDISRHMSLFSFIVAATAGAGISGVVVSPVLGHKRWKGAVLAFIGGIAATFLGAYLAGMMSLPVAQWEFPIVAVIVLLFTPMCILWGSGLALLHWGVQSIREKDLCNAKDNEANAIS